MRGADVMQEELFTLGGLDQYVPADHPLRRVRDVFNGYRAMKISTKALRGADNKVTRAETEKLLEAKYKRTVL